MNIHIDIDEAGKCVMVYLASPDAEDDSEQHDQLFSWEDDDDFATSLAAAESYANKLSWTLGYDIIKNYGELA
jgi:hypothetical protein